MKHIFSSLLLPILFVACQSVPNAVSREPAAFSTSLASKEAGAFVANLPFVYQGPIQVQVAGAERAPATAYLPVQYDKNKSWPLVVMLHGFTGTAAAEDTYLGLRFRVSLRGFILLEPDGTVTPAGTKGLDGKELGGYQFWNATDTCCDFAHTGVDDVGYILGFIEKMKSLYAIDASRIYIFGHSNGGFMANRLGCEAGASLAGIASLAGGSYFDSKNCRDPRPVTYLHIQAIDDKTILYEKAPNYAGGKETVAQWLSKNSCTAQSVQAPRKDFVYLIPGPDTTPEYWSQCKSGRDVALWTIDKSDASGHNAHVPIFNFNFTDAVLDYLFAHQLNSGSPAR